METITHETLLIIIAIVGLLLGSGGVIAWLTLRPNLKKIRAENAKLQAETNKIAADLVLQTAKATADQLIVTAEATKQASLSWIALVNTQSGEIKSLNERLDRHKERIDALEKQHELDEKEIDNLKRHIAKLERGNAP